MRRINGLTDLAFITDQNRKIQHEAQKAACFRMGNRQLLRFGLGLIGKLGFLGDDYALAVQPEMGKRAAVQGHRGKVHMLLQAEQGAEF